MKPINVADKRKVSCTAKVTVVNGIQVSRALKRRQPQPCLRNNIKQPQRLHSCPRGNCSILHPRRSAKIISVAYYCPSSFPWRVATYIHLTVYIPYLILILSQLEPQFSHQSQASSTLFLNPQPQNPANYINQDGASHFHSHSHSRPFARWWVSSPNLEFSYFSLLWIKHWLTGHVMCGYRSSLQRLRCHVNEPSPSSPWSLRWSLRHELNSNRTIARSLIRSWGAIQRGSGWSVLKEGRCSIGGIQDM